MKYTFEDMHATFLDSASPSFLVLNSEAGLGDFGEALPKASSYIGAMFLICATVGSFYYLWYSRSVLLKQSRILNLLQALLK